MSIYEQLFWTSGILFLLVLLIAAADGEYNFIGEASVWGFILGLMVLVLPFIMVLSALGWVWL